jgi:hypothetical protein
MLALRLLLLSFFLGLCVPLLAGCDSQIVGTVGYRLSDMFPSQPDWFWRYNNDGFVEEVWWQGRGESSPDGEAWTCLRWWMNANSAIIDDFVEGASNWNVDLYFADRPSGWHLMGYAANPDGPNSDLGSQYLEDDGIPFLMNDVLGGDSWTASVAGREWTIAATRVSDELSFNGQLILDSWRVDVSSEAGDWPFEGSWWLAQGPGVIQFDIAQWRAGGGEAWQHLHNDTWQNRLGTSN